MPASRPIRMSRVGCVLIPLLLPLAACGGSNDPTVGQPESYETVEPVEAPADPCALVTADQVAEVLGGPVTATPASTLCSFTLNATPGVSVLVGVLPTNNPKINVNDYVAGMLPGVTVRESSKPSIGNAAVVRVGSIGETASSRQAAGVARIDGALATVNYSAAADAKDQAVIDQTEALLKLILAALKK